jgi:hypothetical protein
MIINIRKGVFETNSSSTHAFCVSNNCKTEEDIKKLIKLNNIDKIKIYQLHENDYGWGFGIYEDFLSKLDYITLAFTYLTDNGSFEDYYLYTLIQWLTDIGIEVEYVTKDNIEENERHFCRTIDDDKDDSEIFDAYIDHGGDCQTFINFLFSDRMNLYKFLFDDNSTIITGNDNGDEYRDYFHANAKLYQQHTIYEKLN